MIGIVVWALTGLLMAVVSPRILATMMLRGHRAGVILTVWAALVCVNLVVIAGPVLGEVMSRCAMLLLAGEQERPDAVAALISALILVTATARAARRLRSVRGARLDVHRRHLGLSRILQGAHPQSGSTLWLPLAEPTAYSVAGQPPLVVASTGLRTCLDADALAAVLAHERAHIVRRHHSLVAAADALAAGLPWLPLMRRSPALVRTLVEFDADEYAARTHGPNGLHRALQSLRTADVPAPTLAIAGDAVAQRLARLATYRTPTGPIATANIALTSLTAVLLAVLSSATLMVVAALASCSAF